MSTKRLATVFTADEGIWVQWFGHPLRYLATETETAGKYCMSIGSVDKGQGASPHSHDFDEGFYILKGMVEFFAGNQKVLLHPGDFINIKAGTMHYPRGASEDRADMLVIAAPSGFDQFQIAAGGRLAKKDSQLRKTDDEIHLAVGEIAVRYGIDLYPSAESFNLTPQIQVTRADEGETIDVTGDRYRFLARGEHTGGAYAIWHASITPGGGPPAHIHRREEEAFYVLDGELRFEADGESYIGGIGTFVNLPVGSKHRFSNQSDKMAEVLILVAPAGLENMFRHTGSIVTDRRSSIAKPSKAEKDRLLEVASEYGIELHL